MRISHTFLASSGLLALAACGGGGGGGVSGGGASDAVNYVPVYAASLADTSLTSIDGAGVTGVLSQADLSLSSATSRLRSVKVRISADGNTAFLTVDGSTQTLPVVIKQPGGGQFGNVPNNVLQVVGTGSSHVLVTYSGSGGASGFGGFGYVGIETPLAELPTADATYSGFWGGQVYNAANAFSGSGVVSGNMSVTVNFDNGTLDGTFDGDVNAGDVGSFVGTISGSTVGNGAIGTMLVTSGDFTGSMPIAAKTYGFDAADLAGGFSGTLQDTSSGNSYAATGTFSLD